MLLISEAEKSQLAAVALLNVIKAGFSAAHRLTSTVMVLCNPKEVCWTDTPVQNWNPKRF